MNYKIHDLNIAQDSIQDVSDYADTVGYKRAVGTGRRTGGSAARGNLSSYEYLNTSKVLLNQPLYKKIKGMCEELNIWDFILVNYFLQLQRKDYLDLQDYWEGERMIGKFLSIALTENNSIEVDGVVVNVPKYSAIEFSPSQPHAISEVQEKQTWLVLMVANYVDVDKAIRSDP
tara:strand:+ start:12856 stop:13377 length:522 start_codon:yes stop_codon:yes gene_type:complete